MPHFGESFLFFYVLIYHLFVFTAIRGQFHSCLLSAMYFPGSARLSNIFPWKRISSFDFTRNLSLEAFNAFLNKSRFGRENVRIFARPKCLLECKRRPGMMGGGMKGSFAQRNNPEPRLSPAVNIRKGELLKLRSFSSDRVVNSVGNPTL